MGEVQSPAIREVISVRLPRQTWLSPDGKWVAYWESWADWEKNDFRQRVVVTALAQQKEAFHIDEDGYALQVKWTSDSKSIGYITCREGRSVLYKVNCPSGSAVDVASSDCRFTDFDWHPNSSKVAVAEDAPRQERLNNELFSVEGETIPSAGILVLDMESGKAQRFEGDQTYSISSLSWSRSGDKVLFTAIPEPDIRVQCQHLLMLDLSTGKLLRLIGGERAVFFPVWNEDGSQIAFSERRQCWDDLGGATLKILRLPDLSERVLISHVETKCRVLRWNNGRILISGQVADRSQDVYAVSAESGECVKATIRNLPERTGASASEMDRSVAYVAHGEDRFPEVMLEAETAPAPVRITDYHSQARSWPKLNQQSVIWQSADGQSIEGVLVDARKNCKIGNYPLVVLIHGGPTINMYNTFFHTWLELWSPYPIRQWNEVGISVFMPDYRGSSGYGRGFKEAIVNRLGELEQDDILRGLDYLLAEYGFAPDGIGVAGISYGGYLTMLLAAKYPFRFAAASVFGGWGDLRLQLYCASGNLESYTCEDAWDPEKPTGSQSAFSYISKDCPPMLLQVGDSDKTVPPVHSLAFYRLLKKRGGNVKMVTYKNCGHWINHPKQLLAAQEHNLEWFGRWLQLETQETELGWM